MRKSHLYCFLQGWVHASLILSGTECVTMLFCTCYNVPTRGGSKSVCKFVPFRRRAGTISVPYPIQGRGTLNMMCIVEIHLSICTNIVPI